MEIKESLKIPSLLNEGISSLVKGFVK